jgi:hypothetical protein
MRSLRVGWLVFITMSLVPQLITMGARMPSSKRGAHGPAPARKNRLWDGSAARKGALVVRHAHTNEVLSAKDASQEQLLTYMNMKLDSLMAAAAERGIDLTKAAGRRWLRRATEGRNEAWVRSVTTASLYR